MPSTIPQTNREDEWVDVMGDYALVPVHPKDLKSTLGMYVIWAGVSATIAGLWQGYAMATILNLWDTLVACLIGYLILIVIGGLVSYIGATARLSTYAIMAWPYGRLGAFIWGLVISGIGAGLGWFAVNTWFFGIMMHDLIPGHPLTQVGVAALWGGLLMMITAVIGIKGIALLSYLTVPFWLALASTGIAASIALVGSLKVAFTAQPAQPGTVVDGITMTVGGWIVGAVIAADIARYARSPHGSWIAWALQLLTIDFYMVFGGALITLATGGMRFTEAMLLFGLGLGAYLVAILGQWTTNDNNLYSASLSLTLLSPVSRRTLAIVVGLASTAVATALGFIAGLSIDPYIAFLITLGEFGPAIGGVIIADFYVYRGLFKKIPAVKRYEMKVGDRLPEINGLGWIATVLGYLIGARLITAGIPPINTLLASMVVYSILAVVCDKLGVKLVKGYIEITKYGLAPKWYVERYERSAKTTTPGVSV